MGRNTRRNKRSGDNDDNGLPVPKSLRDYNTSPTRTAKDQVEKQEKRMKKKEKCDVDGCYSIN